ncbi:hypothetical protein S83_065228, partial [Arachis hypogaea]
ELGECSLGNEPYSAGSPVQCYPTQLIIDRDNKVFKVAETEKFVHEMKIDKCEQSYAVVSIMGPQSSGKSTLLNHLFDTDFKEMNAKDGRSQTTKGIWISRSARIEPCTLVLDLEGTDGKELAEQDDISFEGQSALFALAISDIVLINMWCHDIGRHNAANRPLLKTIFQVVMKLFAGRKITLFFVIRDKTQTPFERLKELLVTDMEEMWESVTKCKSDSNNEVALTDFFSVEVVALSNFDYQKEQFKEEVAELREKICDIGWDSNGVVLASDFLYSCQEIWEMIKADKDLDLPSHKVMLAIVRCEEIAREKYKAAKKKLHQLEEDMKCNSTEFLNRFSSQIDTCLSEYDAETIYYHEGPRSTFKNELKEKLLDRLFKPALVSAFELIRSMILDDFKQTFQNALLNQVEDFYAVASCIEASLSNFDKPCPVANVVVEMTNEHKIGVRKVLLCDMVTSSCQ